MANTYNCFSVRQLRGKWRVDGSAPRVEDAEGIPLDSGSRPKSASFTSSNHEPYGKGISE